MKASLLRLLCASLVLVGFLGCNPGSTSAEDEKSPMVFSEKSFSEVPADPGPKVRYIDTDQALLIEKFKVGLPVDFDPEETYGLLVFNSASDSSPLPYWDAVCAQRKLLVISPLKCGNEQDVSRRLGLALLGTLCMQRDYKIDPKRIYAAGASGGARVASGLAFYRPDLYSGTIQAVGSDFPGRVPTVKATAPNEQGYGVLDGAKEIDLEEVRRRVRFVIITGVKDWRYNNLWDIYHGGFKAENLQCLFMDVPEMGHSDASPESFSAALDYIERGR